jgi:hypothetical protein
MPCRYVRCPGPAPFLKPAVSSSAPLAGRHTPVTARRRRPRPRFVCNVSIPFRLFYQCLQSTLVSLWIYRFFIEAINSSWRLPTSCSTECLQARAREGRHWRRRHRRRPHPIRRNSCRREHGRGHSGGWQRRR